MGSLNIANAQAKRADGGIDLPSDEAGLSRSIINAGDGKLIGVLAKAWRRAGQAGSD